MVFTVRVADMTFGGTGADNPVPWSRDNFDLDAEQQTYQYTEMNAIIYHPKQEEDLQVTALVRLNQQGFPMVSPNDLVYAPCPPFCHP